MSRQDQLQATLPRRLSRPVALGFIRSARCDPRRPPSRWIAPTHRKEQSLVPLPVVLPRRAVAPGSAHGADAARGRRGMIAPGSRALVLSYSYTGQSRRVADVIAAALRAR